MTKHLTSILIIFTFSITIFGQITTSNPAIITQSGGAVEIIYDATLGTAGLKNYTGDVYAHTGVITNASTSNIDWKHAPIWGDNSLKYKLVSLGNNKWKFTITPSIASFYGLNANEIVKKLAFVFRSADKTKEGKATGGTDILIDVFQDGLNVSFANPPTNQTATLGSSMNIQVASTLAADLSLKVNDVTVKNASASNTMSHSYTFSAYGDYTLIAEASLNGTVVKDTVLICVPSPVVNEARPSGLKDGINYIDNNTVTLIMCAPDKNNVFVVGDFNNWTQSNAYQMKKDGNYWWITLTGLTANKLYGFQYLVNGSLKVSDPYTELVLDPWNDKWINQSNSIFPNLKPYPEGKTDGLVATFQTAKTAYNWSVPNFTLPNRDNLVIYELLLRDFTPQKSLDAAIAKLDYLQSLGVTAIELMPIQEFDGNNSWGYNPNHYFAPDKAYGTPEAYKRFIDECHKRGIAVILDVVFNHASGINPFALLYWDSATNQPAMSNPWMNTVAPHPYSVMNDFNHSSTLTKEYFKRVLKYWIDEYKVDGYRLDLSKGFTQTSSSEATANNYDQSRIDNLTSYYEAAKSAKNDVVFILEHFCNSDEESALANKGMYLWKNASSSFSQAAMGWQSDSGFEALNSFPRKWVGYAESHDEERNFYKVKNFGDGNLRTDSIARVKRVPLNVAFATLMPGPKMIWQFEEMGYEHSINSFGGRTNEKPSVWDWLSITHRRAAYETCSKVISLKKNFPEAFSQGFYELNIGANDWSAGRRISLKHATLNMVMLGNFQATNSVSTNPNFPYTGIWYNVITGQSTNVTNTNSPITLQPGELALYIDRNPTGIEGIKENNASIYPNPVSEILQVRGKEAESVEIFSLNGNTLISDVLVNNRVAVSSLLPGVYLAKIKFADGTSQVVKLLKN